MKLVLSQLEVARRAVVLTLVSKPYCATRPSSLHVPDSEPVDKLHRWQRVLSAYPLNMGATGSTGGAISCLSFPRTP